MHDLERPDEGELSKLKECIIRGKSKQLLGKEYKIEEIEVMKDTQVSNLYSTYKINVSKTMSDHIGDHAVTVFAKMTCKFFGIEDRYESMVKRLKENIYFGESIYSISYYLHSTLGYIMMTLSIALTVGEEYVQSDKKGDTEDILETSKEIDAILDKELEK